MNSVFRKEVIIPLTIGVVASAGGFAAGYIWRDRKDRKDVQFVSDRGKIVRQFVDGKWTNLEEEEEEEEELSEETEALIREATAIRKVVAKENVEKIVASAPHIFKNDPEESEPITQNVFDDIPDEDDLWDIEAERATRTIDLPYIISQDEYMSNESGLTQEEMTYYAGDDVMCDVRDVPIYGHRAMMGELMFGHGSGDMSIVYIRNEKENREWEICYNKGYFSVEIMGMEIETNLENNDIKHSHRPLHFRGD